jgi:hypothetical protein
MSPVNVSDFITIPAWRTSGQVVAIEAAKHGDDNAVVVMLQEGPDATPRRYRLEPGEWEDTDGD